MKVRLELAEFDASIDIFKLMSQAVERTIFVHLLGNEFAQCLFGLFWMALCKLLEGFRLGIFYIGYKVFRVKRKSFVIPFGGTFCPVMLA